MFKRVVGRRLGDSRFPCSIPGAIAGGVVEKAGKDDHMPRPRSCWERVDLMKEPGNVPTVEVAPVPTRGNRGFADDVPVGAGGGHLVSDCSDQGLGCARTVISSSSCGVCFPDIRSPRTRTRTRHSLKYELEDELCRLRFCA